MGLQDNILQQPVSSLEMREAVAVHTTDSIRHAVSLMRDRQLGCVVVVDDESQVVGKFDERRLMRLLAEEGSSVLTRPVGMHVEAAANAVGPDEPIGKVIDIMEAKKVRFVVVIDDERRPVGLTGQKGIMEYVAEHFPRQIKSQLMESKLYMDQREGG